MTHNWHTKLIETFRESCRHAFLKIRNRQRHPAVRPALSRLVPRIRYDIPQKLLSWFLQNTKSPRASCKSVGNHPGTTSKSPRTSCKSCRRGFLKCKIPLGVHQTVPGDNRQHPKSLGASHKLCRRRAKSLGTSYT